MRDILLFTKEPVLPEKCLPHLTGCFRHGVANGAQGFMLEKPSTLFFEMENEPLSLASDMDFSAEEKAQIRRFFGAEECYVCQIGYHRSEDVKRLLRALSDMISPLYLFVDEAGEEGGYCPAEAYLQRNFAY